MGAGILFAAVRGSDGIRLELNHVPGKGFWPERDASALSSRPFRFAGKCKDGVTA